MEEVLEQEQPQEPEPQVLVLGPHWMSEAQPEPRREPQPELRNSSAQPLEPLPGRNSHYSEQA